MKEFEKWWEDFNRIPLPADEFDFARLAWKAALEWALLLGSDDELYVKIKEELYYD